MATVFSAHSRSGCLAPQHMLLSTRLAAHTPMQSAHQWSSGGTDNSRIPLILTADSYHKFKKTEANCLYTLHS